MTIDEQLFETPHKFPPETQSEVVDPAAFLRYRAPHRGHSDAVQLEPLPVLSGRIQTGWKDAIYEPGQPSVSEYRVIIGGLRAGDPRHA